MRSNPNSSGHGLNDSSHATWSAAEGIELAAIAGELLTLAFDDVGRRVRDKVLVPEDALGAGDLLAQARTLRVGVPVHLRPVGPHLCLEDAALVSVEVDGDAAPREDRGR